MPFQSEKQRRYLWANEPEIARDWADTYGSRIEKNDGGIMRVGLRRGSGGPAGGASAGGNYGGNSSGGDYSAGGGRSEAQGGQFGDSYGPGRSPSHHGPTIKSTPKLDEPKKLTFRDKIFYQPGLKRNKVEAFRQLNLMDPGLRGLWGKTISGLTGQIPEWAEDLTEEELMQIATSGPYLSQQKTKGDVGRFKSGKDLLGRVTEGEGLFNTGKLTQTEWERLFPGNVNTGGGGSYYPRDVHPGTGGTEVIEDTEVVEDTPSAFQESLTGTAETPDYYVGDNPLASNTAWGQKFGVDPRTMGRTSWADGGRIPAAFGGIMDRSTGRRAYGFGSIFKSIKKAASKVLKSPIGKAALLGGLGFGIPGTSFGGLFGRSAGSMFGQASGMLPTSWKNKLLMKHLGKKDGVDLGYKGLDWGKLGIMGATALPWMMPGPEEDEEDKGVDYDLLKNKYASELMNIKRGVNAGSLDPNQWSYLPSDYTYTGAEGGRAGYYAGGQSIPSPYTMEDARKTSMQDKMGGITDVMKRADLSRQGDVGQMYMAQGGRIGYAEGGDNAEWRKIYNKYKAKQIALGQEFADFEEFVNQHRVNEAQGGRIGYREGEGVESIPRDQMQSIQGQQAGGEYDRVMELMLKIKANIPLTTDEQFELRELMKTLNMSEGGRDEGTRMASMEAGQEGTLEDIYADLIAQGFSPREAAKKAKELYNNMQQDFAQGGRIGAQEGGLMDLGGMEKDYRNDGGFVPLGGEEKADDVPARLSKNEFVFTADAVRGAGGGDIDQGAEIMENVMKNLEQGGQISEETQGSGGAQEMFDVSERLSEVV